MIDAFIDAFSSFSPVFSSYILLRTLIMYRIIILRSPLLLKILKYAIIALIIILVLLLALSLANHWNCSIVLLALLSGNLMLFYCISKIKLS